MKEGDTPSFFHVLPDGLSDPEHPEWGNWGGRFRPSGRGNEYVPAEDEIDAHRWEGTQPGARDFVCRDKPVTSPHVPLRPPTDPARAKMIHSFRWSRRARIAVTGVPGRLRRDLGGADLTPGGTYAVYAYVWEETKPQRFSISLNGREVVRGYDSGPPGCWRRLGPWTTDVREGEIVLTTQGGDANLSGIELWQRGGGKK